MHSGNTSKMPKKAQAAMEFIMTYGWAILVVMVAIGALAYFGVLSPDRFLPERCVFPPGTDCIDKAAISSTGEIKLAMRFNLGNSIVLNNVTAKGQDCTQATMTSPAGGTTFANNQLIQITLNCGNPLPAGRFKAEVFINYTNPRTTIEHITAGEVLGRVV